MAMSKFEAEAIQSGAHNDGNGVAAAAFLMLCYVAAGMVLVGAFLALRHFGIL